MGGEGERVRGGGGGWGGKSERRWWGRGRVRGLKQRKEEQKKQGRGKKMD